MYCPQCGSETEEVAREQGAFDVEITFICSECHLAWLYSSPDESGQDEENTLIIQLIGSIDKEEDDGS